MFIPVSALADTARIEAVVLDGLSLTPLEGVCVQANFAEEIGWRAWTQSPVPDVDRKRTDRWGRSRFQGRTNCGVVDYFVAEPPTGYYIGDGWCHTYTNKNLFGVWQPDNLVATIRLQRVEHPIPLCVKNVRPKVAPETFDGTNAVLRYDLMLGDWLPPEGKGERADLEIRTKLTINEVLQVGKLRKIVFHTFSNAVRFLGEGNGCRAEMTTPTAGIKLRVAPTDGYGVEIKILHGTKKFMDGPNAYAKKFTDSDSNRCYYFRIRSRFDDKGKLVEAYYGKVYGDFNFHGRWDLGFRGVDFLYYLNPKSLDRNLEWDMKTNLCPTAGKHESRQP